MQTVIIKYNAGNIQSVMNALNRIGANVVLTDDTEIIRSADRVIFPGVGEARSAMKYLRERELDTVICSLQQPVLGICLGMQLLGSFSEENATPCLNIVPAKVTKIPFQTSAGERLKVPHVGWNTIEAVESELFAAIPPATYFYFVHSFAMEVNDHTIASTGYGTCFSSAVWNKNFYGVQFHPEKSARAGEQLLQNFLNLKP